MTHPQRLREALQSIADCCDEDHCARDYASRQTEIRGIARAALAEADAEQEPAGAILPDGSAFMVASFHLPADHWLYAPRSEWDSVRDDFAETPIPLLSNHQRHAVMAAARYAIRGATMCGKEMDFDPDAMSLNFCYALCGDARATTVATSTPAPAPLVPLTEHEVADALDRAAVAELPEGWSRCDYEIADAVTRALAAKNGLTLGEAP